MVVVVVPSLISPTLPYAQYIFSPANVLLKIVTCMRMRLFQQKEALVPLLLMPVVGDSLRESSQTHELNII
jgi:hypothetical protein